MFVFLSFQCHEKIRVLSHEAAAQVKQEGRDNDLIERIRRDEYFRPIRDQINSLMNPETFVGRAPSQVLQFVEREVEPALLKYHSVLRVEAKVHI